MKINLLVLVLLFCVKVGFSKTNDTLFFKGAYSITELGFNITNIPKKSQFGVTTLIGLNGSQHFNFGIGVGVYGYEAKKLFPVFLNVRLHFFNNRSSPFIGYDIGTIINQGFFNAPFLGIKCKLGVKSDFVISGGVNWQTTQGYTSTISNPKYPYNSSTQTTIVVPAKKMQFLQLKIGFRLF
jgi:hypothetical protein